VDEGRAFVFVTNPWYTEIYVNGVPSDTMPIAVDEDDTIEVVNRGFVNAAPLTSTMVVTWSQPFELIDWSTDTGSVITTTNTLTWEVTDALTDTWHVITKTFSISLDPKESATITESLSIEGYPIQPPDRVLQFRQELQRVFLPLILRED
jgi:hypothetical protein